VTTISPSERGVMINWNSVEEGNKDSYGPRISQRLCPLTCQGRIEVSPGLDE
jgi:hypothetical protein